ncbi:FtsX-like permease family protein [Streptomyces fuscichromogenes]|uniref:ABC transporter permease n=1 Tax=Streptomyces fuscichromogenes TaxID=1324013 RepID=UPI0038127190
MSVLFRVVRSGMTRRRTQTLVITLATLLAVTASVLAGALLVASRAPFDHAFARQRGAQLTARFDARRATTAQVAASARASGVTGSSGPFPTTTATTAAHLGTLSIVGRADPGGAVDRLTVAQGRWARRTGEIVLAVDPEGPPVRLGQRLDFPGLPGGPTLTVVGTARSVSRTADAWVVPAQIAGLTRSGRADGYQMLYRFAHAATDAQVTRDRAALAATVPKGAFSGARSWLSVRLFATRETALYVPFLVAFGVLGLVMSALVVGNVVAGSVGTGLRRIGVLKAVGCTPGEVVRAYVAQALVPAAIGTGLGLVAGHLLAAPLLADTSAVYGSVGLGVSAGVDLAVVGGVLGVVAGTAWLGAWRAGRLRTVDALAVGRTPVTGRGRGAARLAARLPVPRPVGLGLARPFHRPARAASMVAAVVFGTAAVTFATGMAASLGEVVTAKNHNAADVTVSAERPGGPGPVPPGTTRATAAEAAAVRAAIAARPGTRDQYGSVTAEAQVAGVTGSVPVIAYDGDASWGGFVMVSGRWVRAAGEAVVASPFLTASGTEVGDTVTLAVNGSPVRTRIVGEVFDVGQQGLRVFTDLATLRTADPDLHPTDHSVRLTRGTDVAAYVKHLNAVLKPLGVSATDTKSVNGSDGAVALDTLAAMLTLILTAVAGLGVLGGVVLDTHERIRDLGIHKALGMTPRQTVTLVIASVVLPGLAGGALGVPLGLAVHRVVMPAMGDSAGLRLPDVVLDVYRAPELLLLALSGTALAILGALLPAGWAARVRTATALRTE